MAYEQRVTADHGMWTAHDGDHGIWVARDGGPWHMGGPVTVEGDSEEIRDNNMPEDLCVIQIQPKQPVGPIRLKVLKWTNT